jgi:hypothetical protein
MPRDPLLDDMDDVLGDDDAADARGTAGDAPDPEAETERRRYIGPPQPEPAMFYGPIGRWTTVATRNSEASPVAVYISLLTYAGVVFGRGRWLWLDNTQHHPRHYTLHVGRTSRGRKGTAVAPTERLHAAVSRLDDVAATFADRLGGTGPAADAPHVHTGGLSTREGIAHLLRDPVEGADDEGNVVIRDPGEPDKRLWVLESEFENVLSQSGRDGNTLSSALRDCWDGRDLAPLTKTNPTRATAPHVGCTCHVTPGELLARIDARATTNGFLNRFVIFWAERTRLVPFPTPIPQATIDAWAVELVRAAKAAKQAAGEMTLDDVARELYRELYISEWCRPASSDVVTALMERAPAVALRIATTLATMDQTRVIGVDHLACGIAWTRYWRRSVEYVWRDRARLTAADGADATQRKRAQRIVDYLRQIGRPATRTEIVTDCFRRHVKAADLDAAIEWAQLQTPPWLDVREVETQRTKSRVYTQTTVSLTADTPREPCEPCEVSATARPGTVREQCETCEPCSEPNGSAGPQPDHGSHTSQASRTVRDRATADGSHASHTSQGAHAAKEEERL